MNETVLDRALDTLDPRGVRHWAGGYVDHLVRRETADPSRPIQLYVCVADHYEPNHKRPGLDEQRRRVDAWVSRYPAMADRHRDSNGRPHVRTFFFPIDEYRPEHLDGLARLCKDGYGDVEVHLHHEDDTAENLRRSLDDFGETLFNTHGLLRRNATTGKIEYAFIHGNWALDNSHPEGKYCGVVNELKILAETGCYADMTLPSAPSPTQTRIINSIYYAQSRPGGTKLHDSGEDVRVGGAPPKSSEPSLMMIQGPLAPNHRARKFGILPKLEAGELSPDNTVDPELRARVWVEHAPIVRGAPNHRFLKLHAHGTQPGGEDYFLERGNGFDSVLGILERDYSDGRKYALNYVTAREMYEKIKALESGTVAP